MMAHVSYRCPCCGAQAIECAEIAVTAGVTERQALPFSLSFDCAGMFWGGCSAALVVTWRDAESPPLVQTHGRIDAGNVAVFVAWEEQAFARIEAIDDLFGPLPDGVVVAEAFTPEAR